MNFPSLIPFLPRFCNAGICVYIEEPHTETWRWKFLLPRCRPLFFVKRFYMLFIGENKRASISKCSISCNLWFIQEFRYNWFKSYINRPGSEAIPTGRPGSEVILTGVIAVGYTDRLTILRSKFTKLCYPYSTVNLKMGSETEMVSIENTLRCLNTSACLKFKFEKRSTRRSVHLSVASIPRKCCYTSSVSRNDR